MLLCKRYIDISANFTGLVVLFYKLGKYTTVLSYSRTYLQYIHSLTSQFGNTPLSL